jgi:hypothetical protein
MPGRPYRCSRHSQTRESGERANGKPPLRYLRSHRGFEETVADLRRQFRFIGDSGAYHFLWSVN